MTFWVVWSTFNRARHVLCPTHLKQLTPAAMKLKGVSPEEESVRGGHKGKRRSGAGSAQPLLCDWANGRIQETQSILLPHMQERCVCSDAWSKRDLAPLPGDQAPSTRSFGNSGMASALFWRQSYERGRSWATAEADLEGSGSSEGRRVSFYRSPHRGLLWFSWRQLSRACQSFGFGWSIAYGQENTGSAQLEWGGGCAGPDQWCAWSKCSCGVCARRSTCFRGGVRQLSGQWISAETDGVYIVCLALFQTLPSTDCVKCSWNSGPLLLDGEHCEQAEGGRESCLHDYSTSTEESP